MREQSSLPQPHKDCVDGSVRFVYNVTPSTKQLSHCASIPCALHYTPFHLEADPAVIHHSDYLSCLYCGSYVNQYCQVGNQMWVCCICGESNSYQPSKSAVTAMGQPVYDVLREGSPSEKFYVFVVDLCISEEELSCIKKSMLQFVRSKCSENFEEVNLVNKMALITFNHVVYLYELAATLNTVVSIGAEKQYDASDLCRFFSLSLEEASKMVDRCFVEVKTSFQKLERRIRKLKAEGNTYYENDLVNRCRAKRSVGEALNIALTLGECSQKECRVISLIGGPCTNGVGMTIGTSFKQQMRSISEYEAGENIHYFQSAANFYSSLKQKAQGKGTVIDIHIFSLEETGLTQMYELARATGGLLVLGEQFNGELKVFEQSFKKAYISSEDNDFMYSLTSGSTVSISCSKEIKVNGLLNNGKSLPCHRKRFVSEKSIGHGETNCWYFGSLHCYRSLTFVYELSAPKAAEQCFYVQLRTVFRDYWGFKKMRVVTVKKLFSNQLTQIAQHFDQEAAIVMLARIFLFKQEYEPKTNLRQWLDKILVKWASGFGEFKKGNTESFNLPDRMKFLPQFIYHFRRNPIMRRSGLSLDELTYHMHALNSETVEHSICIVQPALLSYSIEKPEPEGVRLEEESMKNSVILMLDTYFHVLLWYGDNIQYWEREGFHLQKEYHHVKALLEAPQEDIKLLLRNRFPHAGFYRVSSGSSKQRILKSKISPSASEVQNENTLTDDRNLFAFMKALIEIVVK